MADELMFIKLINGVQLIAHTKRITDTQVELHHPLRVVDDHSYFVMADFIAYSDIKVVVIDRSMVLYQLPARPDLQEAYDKFIVYRDKYDSEIIKKVVANSLTMADRLMAQMDEQKRQEEAEGSVPVVRDEEGNFDLDSMFGLKPPKGKMN